MVTWADYVSWGTAAVNPVWAAVDAARGERPWCHLGQLAISELVGNVSVITLQRLIHSPRPCLGCAPNGMPSGHTMNSFLGFDHPGPASRYSFRIGVGLALGGSTAGLRVVANRHTPKQVFFGALLGLGADQAGHLLHCEP